MSVDNPELRKGVLYNLMLNEDYCRKTMPFLQEDYFSEKYEKVLFEEIEKYFSKYNSLATHTAVRVELESRNDLTEPVYNSLQDFLNKEVKPVDKIEWLVNKTEEWCQERAIVNAVYKAVAVIGGDDKTTQMSALPDILHKAIGTSFDKSIGHDYIEQASDRWEFYNRKEEKLSTGIDHIDYILKGGIPNKTLGIIMAGTGVGKSLFMCAVSANIIEAGHNVLYITMEMAEEKIAQRIDQNLLSINSHEMDTIGKDLFLKRFNDFKSRSSGKLIVKEYPTGSAGSAHFRALLKELEMKKDFKPDLICVDYLNICKSMTASRNANSYEVVKKTAEELRSISMEFNVPVLSATQTNRSGFKDADVGLENVSESFGLPATADYFFAMTTTDQLREQNHIKISQLKNRYNDITDKRTQILEVDYKHMRLLDLEHQPAHIDALNGSENGSIKPPSLNKF